MFWIPANVDEWISAVFIFIPMGVSVFLMVRYGWGLAIVGYRYQLEEIDRVFNQQLMKDVDPRMVILAIGVEMLMSGIAVAAVLEHPVGVVLGAVVGGMFPIFYIRMLAKKRKRALDEQLVDGINTLASAVRAGLTLVQAFQLLVQNGSKEISQEVGQMLREYELGVDLNLAMRNSSKRIGSTFYRLLFTAIEAHRQRGGDMADSLDRIGESVREIQRLEGRLDALTAQGRSQANMMGIMPFVIIVIYWMVVPEGVESLLTHPYGRLMLLAAGALIAISFAWIRRIMAVDL